MYDISPYLIHTALPSELKHITKKKHSRKKAPGPPPPIPPSPGPGCPPQLSLSLSQHGTARSRLERRGRAGTHQQHSVVLHAPSRSVVGRYSRPCTLPRCSCCSLSLSLYAYSIPQRCGFVVGLVRSAAAALYPSPLISHHQYRRRPVRVLPLIAASQDRTAQ